MLTQYEDFEEVSTEALAERLNLSLLMCNRGVAKSLRQTDGSMPEFVKAVFNDKGKFSHFIVKDYKILTTFHVQQNTQGAKLCRFAGMYWAKTYPNGRSAYENRRMVYHKEGYPHA